MTDRDKVLRIAEVLKTRFRNLTAVELVNLAWDILEAIQRET